MIRHTVMFLLKKELPAGKRRLAMLQFKQEIERLPAVIPQIRTIHVGLNINPAEEWDICLDSTFDSLEDLRTYAIHPDHVAAATALKPYVAARGCVDYEV